MVDIVAEACAAVEKATGVSCFQVVPAERPGEFVVLSVENVTASAAAEHVSCSVVVWSQDFARALSLAENVAAALSANGATDVARSSTIDATERPYVRATLQMKLHRLIF